MERSEGFVAAQNKRFASLVGRKEAEDEGTASRSVGADS